MSFSNLNSIASNNPLNEAIRNPVGITVANRDPTITDVNYDVGVEWYNSSNKDFWKLHGFQFNSATNSTEALWRAIEDIVLMARDPTTADFTYPLGQIWENTLTQKFWLLSLVGPSPTFTATWFPLTSGGAGTVITLSDNANVKVPPDGTGNIKLAAGTGITTTAGANLITIGLTGGSAPIEKLLPDSGTTPVVPDASGQITMAGSGSITTVGALNKLTTQLTGLTNHAVLVGAGTATITKVGPSADIGDAFVSQGVSADPAFTANLNVNAAGSVTQPLQPAFLATGVLQSNVTGDATQYTVTFTTVTKNVQSVFDGTSTFTAPVTGFYLLYSYISMTGGIASGSTDFFVALSGVTRLAQFLPADMTPSGGIFVVGGAALAFLTALSTVTVIIKGTGGAKTMSVDPTNTFFGGILLG
jgi:hypothetical protein